MNHNKHISSCKSLAQKWWWTKLRVKVIFMQWGKAKCAFKIFLEIMSPQSHIGKNANVWGVSKYHDFLQKANQSGPLQK